MVEKRKLMLHIIGTYWLDPSLLTHEISSNMILACAVKNKYSLFVLTSFFTGKFNKLLNAIKDVCLAK